ASKRLFEGEAIDISAYKKTRTNTFGNSNSNSNGTTTTTATITNANTYTEPMCTVNFASNAKKTYDQLNITTTIFRWGESTRAVWLNLYGVFFFLSRNLLNYNKKKKKELKCMHVCVYFLTNVVCKKKCVEWQETNQMIDSLLDSLKKWYPEMTSNFESLVTTDDKSSFLLANSKRLEIMSRERNSPQICELMRRRKKVVDNVDKLSTVGSKLMLTTMSTTLTNEDTSRCEYVMGRLAKLFHRQCLLFNTYNNVGREVVAADCQLLMHSFVQYMDDLLSPSLVFTDKHFVHVPLHKLDQLHSFQTHFQYVAIASLYNQESWEDASLKHSNKLTGDVPLPYYFVIFDESIMQEVPRHRKTSSWENKENEWRNANNVSPLRNKTPQVKAWYAQPGEQNVFHCIVLLAAFIDQFLDGQLGETNLRQDFLKSVLKL
ncbi:hypothetical protein RFI_25218, partial [Reticulomyxa filosa]